VRQRKLYQRIVYVVLAGVKAECRVHRHAQQVPRMIDIGA